MLAAAVLLGACGTVEPFPSATAPTTIPVNPAAFKVHLGTAPQLVPVEQLLSATTGTLDRALLVAAFDPTMQSCNLRARIDQLRASDDSVGDASDLTGVHATVSVVDAAHANVTVVTSTSRSVIPVRASAGHWYVALDGCALFPGMEQSADRTTKSDLRNALTAAKTIYVDQEDYRAATPTMLAQVESTLTFAPLAGAGRGVVGVRADGPQDILFVTQSESGTWFCISDMPNGVGYGQGATAASVDTLAACSDKQWAG